MGKAFNFAAGAFFGAAAGTIAGIMLAPRSGAETRAMAADIANDAWDNARDAYEQGVDQARTAATDFGPMVDAKTAADVVVETVEDESAVDTEAAPEA